MAPQKPPNDDLPSRKHIIDFQIPLPWILSTLGAGALILIGMFFELRQIGQDMSSMKTNFQNHSAQVMVLSSEQTLMKFQANQTQKEIERLSKEIEALRK